MKRCAAEILGLADEAVEKITHAGEQDVEPVIRHLDREAKNVFDTQIACGFIGMAYPVALSKFAQPSRPFGTAGNPVGIDIGTLETMTFHLASEAASRSFSQVSCSRPSIVFWWASVSTSKLGSRYWRVSSTKSSTFLPQRSERYRRSGVFCATATGV